MNRILIRSKPCTIVDDAGRVMELTTNSSKESAGLPRRARPQPRRSGFWLELAIIFGFWTFLAVLTAGSRVLDPFSDDLTSTERVRVLLPVFFNYYMWALLTPLIFWLTSKYSIDRANWMSRVPLHLAIGFVVAIGVDVYDDALRFLFVPEGGRGRPPSIDPVRSISHMWFLNELIVFMAVAAAGFARDYFLRYQARQEEAVQLRAQADRLRSQLSEARLQALRMQINPHFLFNTLHAVSSLVERDPNGVRRMLARLSELLRYTLEDGAEPEAPLGQELNFLERYLEIQRIRFQGHFDAEIDAPEEVRHALIPNLILQPIVENAVKHGASHAHDTGCVWIRARREGDRLVITVADNGPGIEDEKAVEGRRGFGLRNTRERLSELYGDAFDLRFHRREGGGLVARLELPFHTAPDSVPVPSPIAQEEHV